ncbi:MAG: hypothetical protein JWN03_2241 [Nocardia sp.]|nr:hypothetical protein [Nocardia sp.]
MEVCTTACSLTCPIASGSPLEELSANPCPGCVCDDRQKSPLIHGVGGTERSTLPMATHLLTLPANKGT